MRLSRDNSVKWLSFQGRSQPCSPGWARFPLSSFFLKFPSFFSYISSNFPHFLPQFGSPGGQVASPGRPWLRYCLLQVRLDIRMHSSAVFYVSLSIWTFFSLMLNTCIYKIGKLFSFYEKHYQYQIHQETSL